MAFVCVRTDFRAVIDGVGLGNKAVRFEAWIWTWMYPKRRGGSASKAKSKPEFFICKACSHYAASETDLLQHQTTCTKHLNPSSKTKIKPVQSPSQENVLKEEMERKRQQQREILKQKQLGNTMELVRIMLFNKLENNKKFNRWMEKIDKDGNGFISAKEWKKLLVKIKKKDTRSDHWKLTSQIATQSFQKARSCGMDPASKELPFLSLRLWVLGSSVKATAKGIKNWELEA